MLNQRNSILCLAVLTAISSTASAQSSVTIYGKIDLGLVLDSGNPAGKSVRVSSGVSGGSRLGFKGLEDLGGGYKAFFQMETGFCADSAAGAPNFCTGSNQFMGRQAHGDLSGPFGSLSAGRQYSVDFLVVSTIDPFGAGLAPNALNQDGKGNFIVDPGSVRLNNSVTYNTPNFGGLVGSLETALGEQTGDWKKSRETAVAINYVHGPGFAGGSFYTLKDTDGVHTTRQAATGGGTYDFGFVKVAAMVQKVTGSPAVGNRIDTLNILGGVTIPVANGSLLASYINHDDKTSLQQDVKQWGAGYYYPLSKRTQLYTAYAHITNKNGATFHVGNATEVGVGDAAFNLGVVHNF